MENIIITLLAATVGFGIAYYVGHNIILKRKREDILRCAEQDV